jgi:hypothetical protein
VPALGSREAVRASFTDRPVRPALQTSRCAAVKSTSIPALASIQKRHRMIRL